MAGQILNAEHFAQMVRKGVTEALEAEVAAAIDTACEDMRKRLRARIGEMVLTLMGNYEAYTDHNTLHIRVKIGND